MGIKIVEITNNEIILSDEISHCKNCKKPMIRSWSNFANINIAANINLLSSWHVVTESDTENEVCLICIGKGSYPKNCVICTQEKRYPSEFKYELIQKPEYAEMETEYDFVCKQCVKQNLAKLVPLMAEADRVRQI